MSTVAIITSLISVAITFYFVGVSVTTKIAVRHFESSLKDGYRPIIGTDGHIRWVWSKEAPDGR